MSTVLDRGGRAEPAGSLLLSVVRGGEHRPELTDDELAEAVERRGLAVPFDDLLTDAAPNASRFARLADAIGLGWIREGLPDLGVARAVSEWREENLPNLWRGARRVLLAEALGLPTLYGSLRLAKIDGETGLVTDFGLASLRVVTDVGCQKIVALMNTSDAVTGINFKFHGIGTGTTAEASTDTALVTELTTEYNPDSTRISGSQTTGATTKVLRSAGTNTLDSGTPAVTEHGLFSAASAGSLFDRSKFSAINLVGANGDGLTSQYDATFASGG